MYGPDNRVDDTVSGGELTDNVRTVDANNGPTNRTGILGSYWFTVNANAPLGETNFDLNGVYFSKRRRNQGRGSKQGYNSKSDGITMVLPNAYL